MTIRQLRIWYCKIPLRDLCTVSCIQHVLGSFQAKILGHVYLARNGGGMGGGPWPHLKFGGRGQRILWPHLNFGQILTQIDDYL